jgi:hypothetical protein
MIIAGWYNSCHTSYSEPWARFGAEHDTDRHATLANIAARAMDDADALRQIAFCVATSFIGH